MLQLLQTNELFVKRSKCFFGEPSVAYLGHLISSAGVAMDPEKVVAIQTWLCPRIVRALRGFLGLTGYYRKFIAGYGAVTEPLTTLLKGSVFTWIPQADAAFLTLKKFYAVSSFTASRFFQATFCGL
jgi:hypothetical protein